MVRSTVGNLRRIGHGSSLSWHRLGSSCGQDTPSGDVDHSCSCNHDVYCPALQHSRGNTYDHHHAFSDAIANRHPKLHPHSNAHLHADAHLHVHNNAASLSHARTPANAGRHNARPARAHLDVSLHLGSPA